MSAREQLVAAVVAHLKAHPPLVEMAVFDAPPVRRAAPFALVEEPVLTDWSGTGWTGREGRLTVTLRDEGERPLRLRTLLATVEERVPTLPTVLGKGWRLVQLRLVRSRLVSGGGGWSAGAEFGVRMYREHG